MMISKPNCANCMHNKLCKFEQEVAKIYSTVENAGGGLGLSFLKTDLKIQIQCPYYTGKVFGEKGVM